MTRADAAYMLVQVSLNDVVMTFAFAPIMALLLGVTDLSVPWETLLLSVLLCVMSPLAAGIVMRLRLTHRAGASAAGEAEVARFTAHIKPLSMLGLLATVVLLFSLQGRVILEQPLLIAVIAVPLLVQSYGIFAIAHGWAWAWRVPYPVVAPCALTGTSDVSGLAVAGAIGLFGLNSGAALVTVVGVLAQGRNGGEEPPGRTHRAVRGGCSWRTAYSTISCGLNEIRRVCAVASEIFRMSAQQCL